MSAERRHGERHRAAPQGDLPGGCSDERRNPLAGIVSLGETAEVNRIPPQCFGRAIACALLLTIPSAAAAAEVELGLITGVQQTGGLETFEGSLDLAGGLLLGISAGWRVRPDGIVEFAWTRQDSEASGELARGPEHFDVTIDTVEFGGLWETRPGKFRPFLGLSVGGTRLAGPDQDFGEGWYFSGAIGGGVRYFLSDHALLRAEGRATGVLISDGGSLACAFPTGVCRVGVNGSVLGAFSARLSIAATF